MTAARKALATGCAGCARALPRRRGRWRILVSQRKDDCGGQGGEAAPAQLHAFSDTLSATMLYVHCLVPCILFPDVHFSRHRFVIYPHQLFQCHHPHQLFQYHVFSGFSVTSGFSGFRCFQCHRLCRGFQLFHRCFSCFSVAVSVVSVCHCSTHSEN